MPHDTLEKILYGIFALMLCLGVVLLYKFYTLKSEGQGDIAPIAMGQLVKKVPKVWNSSNQPNIKRPISARQAKTDPTPKMGIKQKAEIKSNISKRRFAKQTFLKVPLPGHLKYIDVEIEEGVKSIYGYNYHSKEGLTAAARRGPLTMDQVKQYLKEDKDAIPNLNGKKLSNISEVKRIPAAGRKKGIESIEIISADTDKGQKAHVALINRKDKKGSYVFVYTGPPGRVGNNDGYIDQLF